MKLTVIDIQSKLNTSLLQFLLESCSNKWIEEGPIKIYLRNTRRYLTGNVTTCLDIASVEVHPRFQGRGLFTGTMDFLCKNTKAHYAYVENTLNPIVMDWCIRHHWTPAQEPICFFKKLG
jgi:hypothetical protein